MSLLKKLSDVLKEVFWIKPSRAKKTSARRKKTLKKTVKKSKTLAVKNKVSSTTLKSKKPVEVVKPPKTLVARKPKGIELDPTLIKIGEITHYFERIKVCVIKITQGTVLIGDKLTIVGPKVKFIQKVWSMQIESQDVKVAKKGQLIGVKVDKPVQVGDVVYK